MQATLNLFLEAASGFYTQLLLALCHTFHINLPFMTTSVLDTYTFGKTYIFFTSKPIKLKII